YFYHPYRVAQKICYNGGTDEDCIIALLHDVVEDTVGTVEQITKMFGERISFGVFCLTDSDKSVGNRATRKTIDNLRLASSSPSIQTIKYADMLDNGPSIIANDPDFAIVFMKEKTALLEVMNSGDKDLLAKCWEMINTFEAELVVTDDDYCR
ncbi:UNVERIFIED_CONTAM: hypothetical protein GTU68_042471, partial [Idotea baltica]|nr:hypothetical protein [Idotea baltica]